MGAHLYLLIESWASSIASETQNNFAISFLCGLNQDLSPSAIPV